MACLLVELQMHPFVCKLSRSMNDEFGTLPAVKGVIKYVALVNLALALW